MHIDLTGKVILAPMAGYTDYPMRLLSRESGADAAYSEMLKAEALVRENKKTLRMARVSDPERPVIVQVAGRKPANLAYSARRLEELGADAVDLNLGCPVKKIVREGAGAALLKEPRLVAKIVAAMRKALNGPFIVKTRLGWNDLASGMEIARIVEAEGADAIVVHGRTAVQMFRGTCDLEGIRRIVEAVRVPVVGNGDIRSGGDALRMTNETGCVGVAVGRAAVGDPWIFGEVAAALAGRTAPPIPALSDMKRTIQRHYDLVCALYGGDAGTRVFRKHFSAYLRGMPECKAFRNKVMRTSTRAGTLALIDEMFEFWKSGQKDGLE